MHLASNLFRNTTYIIPPVVTFDKRIYVGCHSFPDLMQLTCEVACLNLPYFNRLEQYCCFLLV